MFDDRFYPIPSVFLGDNKNPADGFWLRFDSFQGIEQAREIIKERFPNNNWIAADSEFLPEHLIPDANCDIAQLVDISNVWWESEDDEEWTLFCEWSNDTASEPTWANFRDAYRGGYDSPKEFAREMREGDVSQDMMMYVDWDWVWEDMSSEYTTYEKSGKTHIFAYI